MQQLFYFIELFPAASAHLLLVTSHNFCVLKSWILWQWRAAMSSLTQLGYLKSPSPLKSGWHLFSLCLCSFSLSVPLQTFSSVSSRASSKAFLKEKADGTESRRGMNLWLHPLSPLLSLPLPLFHPPAPSSHWFHALDLRQSCCYQTLHSAALNI